MPAGKKAHGVETTGSRTRLDIMGALNLNDIDSLDICRFFIAVRETYLIKQKVHIIPDAAGYHRTGLGGSDEYRTPLVTAIQPQS